MDGDVVEEQTVRQPPQLDGADYAVRRVGDKVSRFGVGNASRNLHPNVLRRPLAAVNQKLSNLRAEATAEKVRNSGRIRGPGSFYLNADLMWAHFRAAALSCHTAALSCHTAALFVQVPHNRSCINDHLLAL